LQNGDRFFYLKSSLVFLNRFSSSSRSFSKVRTIEQDQSRSTSSINQSIRRIMSVPTFYWRDQTLHTSTEANTLADAFQAAKDALKKSGVTDIHQTTSEVAGVTQTCRAAITYFVIGNRFVAMIAVAGDDAWTLLQEISDRLSKIKWL
jgi:hypothetical protein